MSILSGRAYAQEARRLNVTQYVYAELCRMTEVAHTYKDKSYIDRCEKIKQNLSGKNPEFEAKAQGLIEYFIVESALNCRIDKGVVDYQSMAKYLKPVFESVYGKQK
jgi:hypothetical protein